LIEKLGKVIQWQASLDWFVELKLVEQNQEKLRVIKVKGVSEL
jgi:hypothetical protein